MSLTSLDVHSSPVSDPAAVAFYLSGMFPHIRCLYSHCEDSDPDDNDDDDDDTDHQRWERVFEILPAMRLIRSEERFGSKDDMKKTLDNSHLD